MLYSEIRQFLSTFIDIEEKNESFDYNLNDSSSLDNYTNELHKFNQIYNSFFMFNNRLVYMFNNYEILLKSDDLKQIVKLYGNTTCSFLIVFITVSRTETPDVLSSAPGKGRLFKNP